MPGMPSAMRWSSARGAASESNGVRTSVGRCVNANSCAPLKRIFAQHRTIRAHLWCRPVWTRCSPIIVKSILIRIRRGSHLGQVNTDDNIEGRDELAGQIEAEVNPP